MPRKSSSEKASEPVVERPATRRSVRLSASSLPVTPQQTRSGRSSSKPSASSTSTTLTTPSQKLSGKHESGTKVTVPKTPSYGRSKEHKEPENFEEKLKEQEQEEKEGEVAEEVPKSKGQQSPKRSRTGRNKEKEVVGENITGESTTKQEASEESNEVASPSARPRRWKQPVTAVTEKPLASRRSGRSRGKGAVEEAMEQDSEAAAAAAAEGTMDADSAPTKGAKRKKDEEEKTEKKRDESSAESVRSPKKLKADEDNIPEVCAMGNEKEPEEFEIKEDREAESVKKTDEDISESVGVCTSLEAGIKGSKDTADQIASVTQETVDSDVRENGLSSDSKEMAESEVIADIDKAGPTVNQEEKMEEVLSNGTERQNDDILLSRKFMWYKGEEAMPSKLAQSFTVVSYNILADFHAQRDFTGPNSWITKEQLSVEYRHKELMKELNFLKGDIICLQEVDTDYFSSTLKPALVTLGYDGIHVPRHATEYNEGAATFFRTNCFSLESSQPLVLSQVAEREIDEAEIEADVKSAVKAAVDSYAVALMTRLKCLKNDNTVTCANIHVAYDKYERQDKQCLQLACAIRELLKFAGGPDKPHIICGDFNSWPDSPPYQLVQDGHLSEKSLTALQSINSVTQSDGQMAPLVNYWSEGFQYSPADNLRSSYMEVLEKEPLTSLSLTLGKWLSFDYIWFSGTSLEIIGVMETGNPEKIKDGVPNAIFPSDHLSLQAVLGFK